MNRITEIENKFRPQSAPQFNQYANKYYIEFNDTNHRLLLKIYVSGKSSYV